MHINSKNHYLLMVEHISYEVLKTFPSFEIRHYPLLIVASVNIVDENTSFRKLFNYISGDNRTREKIAMTAPVMTSEKIPMTSPVISNKKNMMFVLPSYYTENTVPQPTDPDIIIEIIASRTVAILRFRGNTKKDSINKQKSLLLGLLKKEHYKSSGESFLMRYNSPFMPGFFRRNEIGITVIE